MFPYLIFGVALVIAIILLAPMLTRHSAAQVAHVLGIVLAVVAGAIGLFALFTGRPNVTIVALIVLALTVIAMMLNNPGRRARFGTGSGAGTGPTSDVKTDWLDMSLNHRTGDVDGEVVLGRFAGRQLSSLTVEELLALLRECESHDPQSAQLLEAFLDRVAPGWRSSGGGGDAGTGPMTEQEALDILGLAETASDEDIREAHRRLMREHHPDRGGSNWLAARINQAKEVLLGER
jgi:hypothetical protein